MTEDLAPGWYSDLQEFGMQRYWDGEDWTDQTRLGSGEDPCDDPLIERFTPRWIINGLMLVLIGITVLAFAVSLVTSDKGFVLAMALVTAAPLGWLVGIIAGILNLKLPRKDERTELFAIRTWYLIGTAMLTPVAMFLAGLAMFG